MSKSTQVTVIMPAHNAELFVGAAIKSVLNQTYRDFELWVLENGSTDKTLDIAQGFNDPRLKVFQLGPVGFQGAIQYAIDNSRTPWIARMDADDLAFAERLATQMAVLEANRELVFSGTSYAYLTPSSHVFERLPQAPSCMVDRQLLGTGLRRFADPSVVFNREAAVQVGGVDPEFTIGDVPLLFRMLARGPGWQIGQPLYVYRLTSSDSMGRRLDSIEESCKARAKYAPDCLPWLGKPSKPKFWKRVALLELLAGDRPAARVAVQNALVEGGPDPGLRKMLIGIRLGAVGTSLYRRRYRATWRHRRDWEELALAVADASLGAKRWPMQSSGRAVELVHDE